MTCISGAERKVGASLSQSRLRFAFERGLPRPYFPGRQAGESVNERIGTFERKKADVGDRRDSGRSDRCGWLLKQLVVVRERLRQRRSGVRQHG
jgi:hypothetical protein